QKSQTLQTGTRFRTRCAEQALFPGVLVNLGGKDSLFAELSVRDQNRHTKPPPSIVRFRATMVLIFETVDMTGLIPRLRRVLSANLPTNSSSLPCIRCARGHTNDFPCFDNEAGQPSAVDARCVEADGMRRNPRFSRRPVPEENCLATAIDGI